MGHRSLRILYVSRMFPFPPNRGERKRDYYLLRALSQYHHVTLVSRLYTEEDQEALTDAVSVCNCVRAVFVPAPRNVLEATKRLSWPLLAGKPLRLGMSCFPQIGRLINEELSQTAYDVLQIEHSILAHYLRYVPPVYRGAKVIDLHNIETLRLARMANVSTKPLLRLMLKIDARRMRRYEPAKLAQFDHILTVSDLEREQVRAWLPQSRVTTIENGIDLFEVPDEGVACPEQCGPELLFVGSMKYPPNEEAILWFVHNVLPLIQARVPEVHLTVVGHNPSSRLLTLVSDSIEVTGSVPSVEPYYKRAAVVIAPLWASGGTQFKLLEAMNYGVPVISTSLAIQGLAVRPKVDLEVADGAVEFAERVIALLERPEERSRLARNARERIRERYDWRFIGDRLNEVLQETVEIVETRAKQDKL